MRNMGYQGLIVADDILYMDGLLNYYRDTEGIKDRNAQISRAFSDFVLAGGDVIIVVNKGRVIKLIGLLEEEFNRNPEGTSKLRSAIDQALYRILHQKVRTFGSEWLKRMAEIDFITAEDTVSLQVKLAQAGYLKAQDINGSFDATTSEALSKYSMYRKNKYEISSDIKTLLSQLVAHMDLENKISQLVMLQIFSTNTKGISHMGALILTDERPFKTIEAEVARTVYIPPFYVSDWKPLELTEEFASEYEQLLRGLGLNESDFSKHFMRIKKTAISNAAKTNNATNLPIVLKGKSQDEAALVNILISGTRQEHAVGKRENISPTGGGEWKDIALRPDDDWSDGQGYSVSIEGDYDLSDATHLRLTFPREQEGTNLMVRLLLSPERKNLPDGLNPEIYTIPQDGRIIIPLSEFGLSKEELRNIKHISVHSGSIAWEFYLSQDSDRQATFISIEKLVSIIRREGSFSPITEDRPLPASAARKWQGHKAASPVVSPADYEGFLKSSINLRGGIIETLRNAANLSRWLSSEIGRASCRERV